MAKYDITFSCGHTETRQLVGKETQRQSYIAWAGKNGLCAACAKQDKMAGIEAVEAEHDLPALEGSDKQVAWARDIRAKLIVEIMSYIDKMRVAAIAQDKETEFEERSAAMLQMIGGEGSSRYWIDNKSTSARDLLQAAYKATGK